MQNSSFRHYKADCRVGPPAACQAHKDSYYGVRPRTECQGDQVLRPGILVTWQGLTRRGLSRPGLTLVELLVVCSLLAFFSGLVLPRLMTRIANNRLERFAFDVGLLCRECYQSAILTNRPCEISLQAGGFIQAKGASGPFARPIALPRWCRIDGLERPWKALPEGVCDPGPLIIRDHDAGTVYRLQFCPFTGEIVESPAND